MFTFGKSGRENNNFSATQYEMETPATSLIVNKAVFTHSDPEPVTVTVTVKVQFLTLRQW